MKKKIFILLIILMTIFLVTGCKGEENIEDEVEINIEPFYASAVGDEVSVFFTEGTLCFDTPTVELEYSMDKKEWKEYKLNEEIKLSAHESVYFRGNNPNGFGGTIQFSSSWKVKVGGDIMSLIDPTCKRTDVPSNAFSYFFNCSYVNDISDLSLPATTLGDSCYLGMFQTNLFITTIPSGFLPAQELADYCYSKMFWDSGIESVPDDLLLATNLKDHCYEFMFSSCAKLKNVPKLPATQMKESCYFGMFDGCESITEIPKDYLMATELAPLCYDAMFMFCSSLQNMCDLPATKLEEKCYSGMFKKTAIKVSENQSDEYTIPFVIDAVDDGIDYTSYMFTDTPGEYTDTIELGKTYYIAK